MSAGYQDVLNAAMGLTESDQVHLVESLIAKLGPDDAAPLDDAWLAEIDRRSREYDAGDAELIPWSEVKRQTQERLKAHG